MNILGLLIIGLGASLAPLDFSVNIAFPAITDAFGIATQDIRWIALCYVVTYGSLVIWFGAIGDRVGHLKVFRWGLILAAVSTVLCALSPTYSWLVVARILQGVAMALLLSCSPALIIAMFPADQRTRALSVYGGLTALSGVMAPVIGGYCIEWMGWAGVFWFRIPIALVALFSLPLIHAHFRQPRFARSSVEVSRSTLVILFDVFKNGQNFGWINLANVIIQLCSFSVPLILPYYLTRVALWSPTETGGVLAIWASGTLIGSFFAGLVIKRLGVHQTAFMSAWLSILGLVFVAFWTAQVSLPVMLISIMMQGIGLGLFQVAYTDWVVAELPITSRGVAGSLTVLTRTLGIITGALLWLWVLDHGQMLGLQDGLSPKQAFMNGFRQLYLVAILIAGGFFAASGFRFWKRDSRQ